MPTGRPLDIGTISFDVNTITIQGATAIASATAGNKLIIDGCDATTTPLTKAQAVRVSSRPESPASTTTSIALAGSTENHVYAYASFIQGETGQPGGDVHAFYLYGHMHDAPSSVFVIAICSSINPVHLPEQGDVVNRAEVQFELTFSATDEVVTVAGTSIYTTRGEFLQLKNRTVTTHAVGEATTGEDQTIYGDKTFANAIKMAELAGVGTDPITLTSDIEPSGQYINLGNENYFACVKSKNVQFGLNGSYLSNIGGSANSNYASLSFGCQGIAQSSIWTMTRDLGGGVAEQKAELYVRNRSGNDVGSLSVVRNETGSGTVYIEGKADTASFKLDSNGFALTNADLSVDGDLSLTGSVTCSIVPDTNDTYALGSNTYRWSDLYSENINVNFIKQLGQYGIGLVGSIIPSSGSSIGNSNNWLTDLYATNVNATNVYTEYLWAAGSSIETDADILPNSNETQNLGSNDQKFYGVYAKNLHGVIDHPTRVSTTTTIPVGGIFFAALEYDSSVLGSIHSIFVGTQITASSIDHTKPLHIHSACFSNKPYNAGTAGTYRFEADTQTFDDGIYQALSSGICDDTALYVYVLLIKVGTVS